MGSAKINVHHSGATSSLRSKTQLGACKPALSASTRHHGRAVIITVAGEVDAGNEGDWRHLLAQMAAAAAAPGPVVVDVRGLSFMGSCAYSGLARQAERCRRRGITLRLVATHPVVARTVAGCGLRWMLPIHPTVESALSGSGG